MMKVVILGNCQARPLASLLGCDTQKIDIVYIGIVHLLREADKAEFMEQLSRADVIITQKIADNYPCEFVRTSILENLFPGKLIRIANLYFRGYNPELRYLRNRKLGTLRGPLGDYHIDSILSTWIEGGTVLQAIDRLTDVEWNRFKYAGIAEESLSELKYRDQTLDVPVAPHIETCWQKHRFFFTFNHPSIELLNRYASDIFYKLAPSASPYQKNIKSEPLDQFQLPINPLIDGSKLPSVETEYLGVEVNNIKGWSIDTGKRSSWTVNALVNQFWTIYTENKQTLEEQLKAA